MDISNIQIGLDIATAISVIMAAFAFIHSNISENKKNRKAERDEQKKLRNLRVREYRIEKISEVIFFLNKNIHRVVEINNEIDLRLQIKEDSKKVKISSAEKREISYLLRHSILEFTDMPEKYKIFPLLKKMEDTHQKMVNYLSYNPFIDFIGDKTSVENIEALLNFEGNIFKRVNNIENNPGDFSNFLKLENENGYLAKGKHRKDVEEENQNKSSLPNNYENKIKKSCLDDFNELSEKKKIDLYFKYLKKKLEKLHHIRNEWIVISEITNEIIRSLSSYSFKLIQNYEDNQ